MPRRPGRHPPVHLPDPAYEGWRWAVTLARASRAKTATVSEVVLLPGPDAILAPEWVPWRERLRPGDVGVGDILPASADDERLVPVLSLAGDDGAWRTSTGHAAPLADLAESRRRATSPAAACPCRHRPVSCQPMGRDDGGAALVHQ